MCVAKIVVEKKSFWSAVIKEHVELHGKVRLIMVRVAPLGIFSSAAFVDAATIMSAKQKRGVAFPKFTRSLFHVRVNILWLPVDFTDGGGTKGAP